MTRALALLVLGVAGLSALGAAPVAAQPERPSTEALAARVVADSADAEARRLLAQRHLDAADPEAAVPHLAWLAAQDSTDAGAHRRLADVALWAGDAATAALAFGRLVALEPDDLEARIQLAEIVTWSGGADRASVLLAPIAEARPDDARVQKAYAFALHASGDEAAARAQYTVAVGLAPDDAGLLLEAGAIERWTGDWELGTQRLRRALTMDLDEAQRERARELIAGLLRQVAPTVVSEVTWVTDSNGLTRVSTPVRASYTLDPRWGFGADLDWNRLATSLDGAVVPSAVATGVVPFVAYTPSRRLRLEAGAGFEASPNGRLHLRLDGAVERVWTGRRFALVRLDVESATSDDGVGAIDDGLRRTQLAASGYAEPAHWLAVNAQAVASHFEDGNVRALAALGARGSMFHWGDRPDALPSAVRLDLAGSVRYEDSGEVYPSAVPYYTPDRLVTAALGIEAALAPTGDYTLAGSVGLSHQEGPAASATSAYYRAAVGVDRGRHAVTLEVRRTGSVVYSDDTVSLRYRLGLW